MAYTDIDKPTDYFETELYSGSSSDVTMNALDFQPDWVWLKKISSSGDNLTYDSVRGTNKRLTINGTDEEVDRSGNNDELKAFNSDGWTLGTWNSNVTGSGSSNVSWNWKAGTSFTNDASSTGVGTIDSSGSVSDTSGFSIVIRTGTASAGTIKHGLSTVPKMIITKMRNAVENWGIYHVGIGNTKYLKLDANDVEDSSSGVWNNTTPTASVFSVGSSALVNGSGKTYVDYIFSDVQGYSKFGSYTGNGNADGPFVYTGFKPAWIMIKKATGSANNWYMMDNKRTPNNVSVKYLLADTNAVEETGSGQERDFLSNGFKIRNSNNGLNTSGETYVYMAFAESPFVNSAGAVPTNAK